MCLTDMYYKNKYDSITSSINTSLEKRQSNIEKNPLTPFSSLFRINDITLQSVLNFGPAPAVTVTITCAWGRRPLFIICPTIPLINIELTPKLIGWRTGLT